MKNLIIKDMEMPKNCDRCPFLGSTDDIEYIDGVDYMECRAKREKQYKIDFKKIDKERAQFCPLEEQV